LEYIFKKNIGLLKKKVKIDDCINIEREYFSKIEMKKEARKK
jgi:hypothetical protein